MRQFLIFNWVIEKLTSVIWNCLSFWHYWMLCCELTFYSTFPNHMVIWICLNVSTNAFQVWARIWSVLANHFISAGSHNDEKIAMYAIDSLRQLAIKYFERAELTNFTFQNDILKPFVIIIRKSRSESIRHLIVDCIIQVLLRIYYLLGPSTTRCKYYAAS